MPKIEIVLAALLLSTQFCPAATPAEPKPAPEKQPPNPLQAHLELGRALFQKQQYLPALQELTAALALQSDDRGTRMLAGLAAYWGRHPADALKFWTVLLDTAKRNTDEEWDIERHRVMALSAMDQAEAAQQVIERLYELQRGGKSPAASAAKGFVREHLYVKDVRAGCWETMDERGERSQLWSFPVVALEGSNRLRKCVTVETALLPSGGAGFILAEEGRGYRRIYKRWVKRPEYAEVRKLVIQALEGTLPVLQEMPAANEDEYALENQDPKPAPVRNPDDQALVQKIAGLQLDSAVSQFLLAAARLQKSKFDVTKIARLSLSDPAAAQRTLEALREQEPYMQADAAALVDALSHAKAREAQAMLAQLPGLGPRGAYLDFALLTALNTRGRDVSAAVLAQCSASTDFVVRQTAALLLARQGDRGGLEQLFQEIRQADLVGCTLLNTSLEELLGSRFPAPPAVGSAEADEGVKVWQARAAKWWQDQGAQLQPVVSPKPGEPWWK